MAMTDEMRAVFKSCLGPVYESAYPVNLDKQFPRVMEKIVKLWGSDEMQPYFEELLLTERQGRAGFPNEVAQELFHLFAVYHRLGLASHDPEKPTDIWNWVNRLGFFEKDPDSMKLTNPT